MLVAELAGLLTVSSLPPRLAATASDDRSVFHYECVLVSPGCCRRQINVTLHSVVRARYTAQYADTGGHPYVGVIQCCYAVMLLPLCCLLSTCGRRQLYYFLCGSVVCAAGLLIALRPLYGSKLSTLKCHVTTPAPSPADPQVCPCACACGRCAVVLCSGWLSVLWGCVSPLSVWDLTPSIGLQWYFFTQTFDRFRLFFQLVLAVLPVTLSSALCLTPPLAVRSPHIATVLVCCVVQLLHPQPVLGGLAVCACLLLGVSWLVGPWMRSVYVQVCVLLFSVVMLQLMWFMWLSPGSGNANFFYFQTLLFSFAFAALIVEFTAAARKQCGSLISNSSNNT